VKSMPSKRASPPTVANQRYPSAVCAMARTSRLAARSRWSRHRGRICESQLGIEAPGRDRQQAITNRLAGRSLTTLISATPGQTFINRTIVLHPRRYVTLVAAARQIAVLKMKLAYIRWKDAVAEEAADALPRTPSALGGASGDRIPSG